MPRYISYSHTTQQVYDQTKDVTRRMGWANLEVGQTLIACEKVMGLRKGQSPWRIWPIEVISLRHEPLWCITQEDVIREGFPHLAPWDFIKMYQTIYDCTPCDQVHRIEFDYLPREEQYGWDPAWPLNPEYVSEQLDFLEAV